MELLIISFTMSSVIARVFTGQGAPTATQLGKGDLHKKNYRVLVL